MGIKISLTLCPDLVVVQQQRHDFLRFQRVWLEIAPTYDHALDLKQNVNRTDMNIQCTCFYTASTELLQCCSLVTNRHDTHLWHLQPEEVEPNTRTKVNK